MSEFFRRLRYFWNRKRLDEELASDMEVHREMASRQGSVNFGSPLRLREEAREAWGWMWIDRLWLDVKFGFRVLRKSPGFTAAAVLILAIGIGVNLALFGAFNLFVLKPVPVRDPASLLRFHRRSPERFAFVLPYPEMTYFRDHCRSLSAVLAFNRTNLSIEGEGKPLKAHFVTPNFFTELGGRAITGRLLDPVIDGASNAPPVVVLSYEFWSRHFGGDPSIVGSPVHLNGKAAEVIGIAARGTSDLSLDDPDVWTPLAQQPYFANGSKLLSDFSEESSGVQMWGRLAAGATPKIAEQELRSLAAELRQQFPSAIRENEALASEPGGYTKSLAIGGRRGSGSEENQNEAYPILGLAGALGLLILAVACGNLGSLLLARGVAREREIATRVAVGAGRGRLIRQLFTESLLLALFGSAAGLALGYFVLRGLMQLSGTPAWLNPLPDWRVIAAAMCIGFLASLLFGLMPALQAAQLRRRRSIVRQVLVVAQVAASCVLLIVAGLLVRALNHAVSAQPGFQYEQVTSIDPGLAGHGYSPGAARAYLDTLETRLRALPGVQSVALTDTAPMGNRSSTQGIEVAGKVLEAQIHHVDSEFFQTMHIPLLSGRNLQRGDVHAVIVSQSFAQRIWPTENPLGKQLPMGNDSANETVVGIAGSARMVRMEDPDMVEVYYPVYPSDLPGMVVLVKSVGPPEGIAQPAVSIAREIDPSVFPEVQLLKNSFHKKIEVVESGTLVISLLGSVAHLLACLGIVGVVAYAVSQRTKEIGIRMALGAKSSDVLSLVLRQFSRPVAIGLLVGVGGAAALSQVLRRLLYGVSPIDPIAYAAAIGIFLLTVAVAALLPARRALRVDPMLALRCD